MNIFTLLLLYFFCGFSGFNYITSSIGLSFQN